MFPFEITYTKQFDKDIDKFSSSDILDFFKKDFEKSNADRVELTDDSVIVKNDWFILARTPGYNWNRWIGISSAKFQIIKNEENKRIGKYTFNLTPLLLISTLISLLFIIVSHVLLIGLITFFFLGFLNWIIKLFQHQLSYDSFITEKEYNLNDNTVERLEREINEEK